MTPQPSPPLRLNDFTITDDQLNTLAVNFYFSRLSNDTAAVSNIIQVRSAVVESLSYSFKKYCENNGVAEEPTKDFEGRICQQLKDALFLYIKVFPAEHNDETLLVQLGASTKLGLPDGWTFLRNLFKDILSHAPGFLSPANTSTQMGLIGHTFIYKTNSRTAIASNTSIASEVLDKLESFSEKKESSVVIAADYATVGSVFLTGLNRPHSDLSTLIYLVVCNPNQHNVIFAESFFENGSIFTITDMYVHKSSFQWLQLHQSDVASFEKKINELNAQSQILISKATEKRNTAQNEDVLKDLATLYNQLIIPYTELRRLEISLKIQRRNYQHYATVIKQLYNQRHISFINFFNNRIESQHETSETMVSRFTLLLDTSKTIISLSEANESKQINDRMSHTQLYLTIIGAGIAFVQIFDNEAAVGVLKMLNIVEGTQSVDAVSWYLKLMTKTVMAILLVLGILYINKRLTKKVK